MASLGLFDIRRVQRGLRELWYQRALRGPYRYLVRRWDSVSDIDLAVRVLGTEFFEKMLKPVPLPVESLKSILVLAPHQDDEVLGAGGALLRASAAGAAIDVLFITDGAQTTAAFASSAEEAVAIRNAEAAKACSAFRGRVRHFGLSNQAPRPALDDLKRLAELLREIRPQVVMAPWLLDSPAKHRLVNHLLWATSRCHDLPAFEVWGYQVHNTLFPNGYVDITDVADEKRRLLQYYESQNRHCQCYDHIGMAMCAWNSRFLEPSPAPRYVEVFFTLPVAELVALVERFYFKDLVATYRGNLNVVAGMQALHSEVLSCR